MACSKCFPGSYWEPPSVCGQCEAKLEAAERREREAERRERFRWNRSKYRKAESLARYFDRHVYDLPSEPPELVRRYVELWEQHPQRQDELEVPFRNRRRTIDMLDSIPF